MNEPNENWIQYISFSLYRNNFYDCNRSVNRHDEERRLKRKKTKSNNKNVNKHNSVDYYYHG